MLKIPDFTKPELEYIKSQANFTKREEELFDLRAKDYTHDQCVELMHISESTEKRTNKRMLAKIIKVL